MSIQTLFPYTDEDNYDFNSSDIEIVGGVAKLVAQISGAQAYLYTKLDDNMLLVATDSSGNLRHGGFQGGLDTTAWTTGKINSGIVGNNSGIINFNGIGGFERTDAFTLECWIKTTGTVTQGMVTKQLASGTFAGYNLALVGGKIRWTVRDVLGNITAVESVNTYNDDAWHHVVATYDGSSVTAGLTIYVDNSVDTTDVTIGTMTGTLINAANFQISGRGGNNIQLRTTSTIDEVVVYERELTAAEIAIRWNGGSGTQTLPGATTTFPITNPSIIPQAVIRATALASFASTITAAGSDSVKFVIEKDGSDLYWNGSSWSSSTGFSQSNTLTEVQTNITSLISSGEINSIRVKAFLHSDDGSTTPELSDFTLTYDFAGEDIDIDKATVTGFVVDTSGNPVEGATIKAVMTVKQGIYDEQATVFNSPVLTTTSQSNGRWSLDLIETTNASFQWKIIISYSNLNFTYIIDVPNQASVDFSEIVGVNR